MNSKGITIILENNRNEMQEFSTNLDYLGYDTPCIAFSAMALSDIVRLSLPAMCIILTEWDDERPNACEHGPAMVVYPTGWWYR